jgi:hypothetical protein
VASYSGLGATTTTTPEYWIDGRRSGRGEGAFADPERRPLILRSSFGCAQLTEVRGDKMHIDLDSCEAGYAHGRQGRPPRCAIDLDQVSYLSGFCHGRAWRAQSRTKSPPLFRSLVQRALSKNLVYRSLSR